MIQSLKNYNIYLGDYLEGYGLFGGVWFIGGGGVMKRSLSWKIPLDSFKNQLYNKATAIPNKESINSKNSHSILLLNKCGISNKSRRGR